MSNTIKKNGQIFTPEFLVHNILNTAGYVSSINILKKHCIDNSCGSGAFLTEIVHRYIVAFNQYSNDKDELKKDLETFIHGIEKDPVAYKECLNNLNTFAKQYGVNDVKWNIICGDALQQEHFYGLMDFVVGNPPYVRVHNLDETYSNVKQFTFAQNGMTDLFLVFFELGFKMLSKKGKLCYITPSSWLNSLAGSTLRKYIKIYGNLVKLIDLEHFQAFDATTYTIISLFENGIKRDSFMYAKLDPETLSNIELHKLAYEDSFINDNIYLTSPDMLKKIKTIYNYSTSKRVVVKNGFATLADKIFIRNKFPFNRWLIPVLKASTGVWYQAFFPYNHKGKPLAQKEIFSDENVAEYLESNKDLLQKDNEDNQNWYLYGRTQALCDVFYNKYAINTCIKDIESIKLNYVPMGAGVYSGLYILSDIQDNELRNILCSTDFIEYIKALKKYKNGGYYTFNSKDLEHYLNYMLGVKEIFCLEA